MVVFRDEKAIHEWVVVGGLKGGCAVSVASRIVKGTSVTIMTFSVFSFDDFLSLFSFFFHLKHFAPLSGFPFLEKIFSTLSKINELTTFSTKYVNV